MQTANDCHKHQLYRQFSYAYFVVDLPKGKKLTIEVKKEKAVKLIYKRINKNTKIQTRNNNSRLKIIVI